MPTAAPINVPLREKTEENYRAYIDTALELEAKPENGLNLLKTASTSMWYIYFNGFSTCSVIC